jgi:60 kDa SS-A/Ro ribonucleoprotein
VKKYLKNAIPAKATPQTQPIPGKPMVKNNAGGYTFEISIWERLKKFTILGAEGGTYYTTERALTLENATNVQLCIQTDGLRTVREIVAISDGGRAPRNDPAIFALAMAASMGDAGTRKAAFDALPQVCRIGTHLFAFVEFVQTMRGWGRGLRRAVGAWYTEKTARDVVYQVVKYRQRNGWTHTDTLRKAHPIPSDETYKAIFQWITRRDEATWAQAANIPADAALAYIHAFERVQQAQNVETVLSLIQEYKLPREALPTDWLREPAIWEALLQDMPMTAMIRNLGVMSKVGLLVPMSHAEQLVVARLTDAERLRKARVHPIAVLSALRVYGLGISLKGQAYQPYMAQTQPKEWQPTPKVLDALDSAFELAFQAIEPTNKRTMLALDVSGSMTAGNIVGVPGLTPRDASAAMAMVTARTERDYMFTAFCDKMVPLNISAKMRLDDVIKAINGLPFGGTDCALPMLYALDKNLSIDTFVVYTDNETWAGKIHPSQALAQYREQTGIPAKLIVVGMTATQFSIADPNDMGMMDVIGFDSAAPGVMADFSAGRI